ncbi:MAG TPA: hypothetical protein VFW00_04470 [Rhodocyclaceae bacterium]|nr:hypothetical protein [Rhodocyclaceae bacterium]
MKKRFLLASHIALLAAFHLSVSSAQAVIRKIPPNAQRAELQVVGDGVVTLNGKPFHLSPAAQIRNTNNLLMLTQSMQGTYQVRAQLDSNGAVYRVWILTPAEAASR